MRPGRGAYLYGCLLAFDMARIDDAYLHAMIGEIFSHRIAPKRQGQPCLRYRPGYPVVAGWRQES